MRIIDIRTYGEREGITQLKASFQKNYKHYFQEALGLAIFMISACFFAALLESRYADLNNAITNGFYRRIMMGVLMGFTALFIFYSPFTSPSGSHINPAVTITFFRLGKMCKWDVFFYIIFQVIGGTVAVYLMQLLIGNFLTDLPVNSVVTVPGQWGIWPALVMEFIIGFIMMTMVLFTSNDIRLRKYTRIIAACLVCIYVIIAGPVSGFGMNPARSFASALPSNTWTAFWIYLITPFIAMLSAGEIFLLHQGTKKNENYSIDKIFKRIL